MGYIGADFSYIPVDTVRTSNIATLMPNDDNQHRKLISTIDAAWVANPTFSSSVITDDYDYYDVYVYDVKPTSNTNNALNYLWCRFNQGGSTISSNAYMSRGYHIGMRRGDNWEASGWAYDMQGIIYLTHPNQFIGLAPDSEGTFHAWYRFYNLRSTTTFKGVRELDGQYYSNYNVYGSPYYVQPFGFMDTNTSSSYNTKVDGIVFGIGYGSPFTQGTFKLYGWKK